MRRTILISIIFGCLTSLSLAQNLTEKEISGFLDAWHHDAARADMDAYFDKIDKAGVFIGTDETEVWSKQAFYDWSKPHFDKGKAWDFTAFERNIRFKEDVPNMAWFDEKLKASYGNLRGSGVVHKVNGEWKILHYVLSLPVPNDKFKAVMEVITQ